jgi:hypothetical protein
MIRPRKKAETIKRMVANPDGKPQTLKLITPSP